MSAIAEANDLQKQIAELGPWFQNIDLHGTPTDPSSIDPALPALAAVLADFRASQDGQPPGATARSVLTRALDLIQAWLANADLVID